MGLASPGSGTSAPTAMGRPCRLEAGAVLGGDGGGVDVMRIGQAMRALDRGKDIGKCRGGGDLRAWAGLRCCVKLPECSRPRPFRLAQRQHPAAPQRLARAARGGGGGGKQVGERRIAGQVEGRAQRPPPRDRREVTVPMGRPVSAAISA